MKFFTKFLADEEEIKPGDYWIRKGKISNEPIPKAMRGCKRVQMYLCKRDIYYGELPIGRYVDGEVVSEDPPIVETTEIVGRISPLASWVKEGDKFFKNEVKFMWDDGLVPITYNFNDVGRAFMKVVAVKCKCGCFH